jgi:uroporphyrinogen-III synthase
MSPIHVLVVRPEADARRTAAQLAAQGHTAVVAPILRIEPTGEAPPPGTFDAVAITSANAVPALASIRERIAATPLYAVGQRTTAAIRDAGLGYALSSASDAPELADVVAAETRPGGIVLHVAGRDRKEEPAATLVRRGFDVVVWAAYAAVAVAVLPEAAGAAFAASALDAALHYSRRTTGLLMALAADAGHLPALLHLRHVCISEDAGAPLRAAGARRLIVAARPDDGSVVAALRSAAP